MHQMRADEPSAAGHEKASHPKSLKQLQKRQPVMLDLGRDHQVLLALRGAQVRKHHLCPRVPTNLGHPH